MSDVSRGIYDDWHVGVVTEPCGCWHFHPRPHQETASMCAEHSQPFVALTDRAPP